MKIGLKKPLSNRLGIKSQAHHLVRLGLKASDIVSASAPVALLGGPELAPVASALETGGQAGKAVFGLASKVI